MGTGGHLTTVETRGIQITQELTNVGETVKSTADNCYGCRQGSEPETRLESWVGDIRGVPVLGAVKPVTQGHGPCDIRILIVTNSTNSNHRRGSIEVGPHRICGV